MSEIDFQQHSNLNNAEMVGVMLPDYFDSLSAAETGAVFCLVDAILNNPGFVHPEHLEAESQHYSANAQAAFIQFLSQELSKVVRN